MVTDPYQSPEAKFERFHRQNPHVYDALVSLAREKIRRTGRHKMGISQLIEVCRWDLSLETTGDDFKINASYAAFYARLIMFMEPDLSDIFFTREARGDAWLARYAAEHPKY